MKPKITIKDYFLTREDFSLVRYKKGVLKTEPDLDEKALSRYYDSNQYASHNTSPGFFGFLYSFFSKQMLRVRFNTIKKHIKKDSLIVDFGCGKGDFVSHLVNKNHNAVGIEKNQKAIKQCSKRNLKVESSLKSLNKKIDMITFWHSFEHLSSPKKIIKEIKHFANSNITIAIALPNYKSYDAKHYKSFWAAYDVPRHRFHYSVFGIKQTMKDFGFECIKTKAMCLDSFYISMVSEKYKNNKLFFFKGFVVGFLSNFLAFFNSNYSSSVFIFKKAV